jgi:hypothetical protein
MTFLLSLWLVLGALLILGLRPLLGGWGSPAIVVWPPYVLLGLALTAVALKASIPRGAPPTLRSLRPVFIFGLGGGLLFALHPLLARYSDAQLFRIRLARSQTAYTGLMAQLPTDSAVGRWRWHAGLQYLVDSGPPLRVAILQQGRGYDGNEVALYDPVGQFAPGGLITGPPRPFDGRLEGCRPIQGLWHRCLLRRRSE